MPGVTGVAEDAEDALDLTGSCPERAERVRELLPDVGGGAAGAGCTGGGRLELGGRLAAVALGLGVGAGREGRDVVRVGHHRVDPLEELALLSRRQVSEVGGELVAEPVDVVLDGLASLGGVEHGGSLREWCVVLTV